jgi:uncharacterized glyoxalase superfamily protein PhnB
MKNITAIPVFHVADADASARCYTQVLGFTESFRMGACSGLKIGECELHVMPPGDFGRSIGGGNAYVICDEVDQHFATIKAAGARPKTEPGDRMYGMRDFVVVDPDGNQLSFGCDIERTSSGGEAP